MAERKLNCERCGHSPDKHSCDDSKNYDLAEPSTPFRCNIDGCDCPDFEGEVFADPTREAGDGE